jgi:ribosomal protein L40E
MALRNEFIFGSAVALILGGGFAIFWISSAASHGAPAFFLLFGVVFLAVLVISVGGTIIKTLGDQAHNEAAPVLMADAVVAAKRLQVVNRGKSHSTEYYATFDLGSGERIELELDGKQYGLLAEEDRGALRYQGTWFLDFDRQAEAGPAEEVTVQSSLVCEYCGAVNPPSTARCAGCGSGKLTPVEPKVET